MTLPEALDEVERLTRIIAAQGKEIGRLSDEVNDIGSVLDWHRNELARAATTIEYCEQAEADRVAAWLDAYPIRGDRPGPFTDELAAAIRTGAHRTKTGDSK